MAVKPGKGKPLTTMTRAGFEPTLLPSHRFTVINRKPHMLTTRPRRKFIPNREYGTAESTATLNVLQKEGVEKLTVYWAIIKVFQFKILMKIWWQFKMHKLK